MSGVNVSTILTEAKNLASKLQDDDRTTEALIVRAQSASEKILCLKEYKENLNDLQDNRIGQRSRSALVHNLQQENRQIKILQEENRQLKMALEEHQVTIDLIMKRYRQQVTELMKLNQFQQNAFHAAENLTDQEFYTELNNLAKFASLFEQCIRKGEEAARKDQQEVTRLRAENQLLRRLLKIAADHCTNVSSSMNVASAVSTTAAIATSLPPGQSPSSTVTKPATTLPIDSPIHVNPDKGKVKSDLSSVTSCSSTPASNTDDDWSVSSDDTTTTIVGIGGSSAARSAPLLHDPTLLDANGNLSAKAAEQSVEVKRHGEKKTNTGPTVLATAVPNENEKPLMGISAIPSATKSSTSKLTGQLKSLATAVVRPVGKRTSLPSTEHQSSTAKSSSHQPVVSAIRKSSSNAEPFSCGSSSTSSSIYRHQERSASQPITAAQNQPEVSSSSSSSTTTGQQQQQGGRRRSGLPAPPTFSSNTGGSGGVFARKSKSSSFKGSSSSSSGTAVNSKSSSTSIR